MKSRLIRGDLGISRGFSMTELLLVLALLMLISAFSMAITTYFRQNRFRAQQAAESVATAIGTARKNAWVGIESENDRTVKIADIAVGSGVRFLPQLAESEIPGIPMLDPTKPLIFEPQTGKIPNNQWGAIIIHDDQTQTSVALVIQSGLGPIKKYIRYSGQNQFQPVVNNVY